MEENTLDGHYKYGDNIPSEDFVYYNVILGRLKDKKLYGFSGNLLHRDEIESEIVDFIQSLSIDVNTVNLLCQNLENSFKYDFSFYDILNLIELMDTLLSNDYIKRHRAKIVTDYFNEQTIMKNVSSLNYAKFHKDFKKNKRFRKGAVVQLFLAMSVSEIFVEYATGWVTRELVLKAVSEDTLELVFRSTTITH